MIHFINLYLSILLNEHVSTLFTKTDECSWYFTTFMIDLMPGLPIIYLISTLYERLFISFELKTLIPGNYVNELDGILIVKRGVYTVQVLLWVSILLLSKVILILMQMPLITVLTTFSLMFMRLLGFSVDFKLFFVMIFFPLVVNVIIFWISDTLLKKKVWFPEEEMLKRSFYEID